MTNEYLIRVEAEVASCERKGVTSSTFLTAASKELAAEVRRLRLQLIAGPPAKRPPLPPSTTPAV